MSSVDACVFMCEHVRGRKCFVKDAHGPNRINTPQFFRPWLSKNSYK